MTRAIVPSCLAPIILLLGCQASFQSLEPGDTFSEKLRDGGRGPEMVVIPAGSFRMGCRSRGYCPDDEKPVHTVTISQPFAVSKYEVTFDDYDRFRDSSQLDVLGWGRGRRPVINVSWTEAKEYVAWLTSQTGHEYRLLTEAEWEYAARAGSTTRFHFGNNTSLMCRYANFGDVTAGREGVPCSDGVGRQTAVVGRYAPNAFGLHDMHGNVAEWVEDCWNENYFGAPTDGSAWLEGICEQRILRGGCWFHGPDMQRSAKRTWTIPDSWDIRQGLRVARTLDP